MANRSSTCPKCMGSLEEGFVVDESHTQRHQSSWVTGPAEPSYWLGGIKTGGKTRYPVTTYRCSQCGYLESYAALPAE
jgi:predicted nucleic-acid-binding Zn-ribbon protein